MSHNSTNYDFATASEYTYDVSKVEISGGVAKLININTPTDFEENFNDAAGLTFNSSLIEIVGGANAALKLQDNAGQTFTQDFASSTGFTYNASNTEFAAGVVRQIDQTPSGSLVATTCDNFQLTWSKSGSIVGNNNNATIVGGKIECDGANKYVYWNNAAIQSCGSTLSLKFKYTPLYSGSPAFNVNIASIREAAGNINRIILYHGSGGSVRFTIYNSAGAAVSTSTPFPIAFSPTSGVEYEILFEVDATTGDVYCFVDGVSLTSVNIGAFTRTATASYLQIGSSSAYVQSDGRFDDLILFNNIQTTINYAPGYTIAPYIYNTDVITCPTFTYIGIGALQAFTNILTVETNAPRYIVNGQYYNAGWVASSDTWATASPIATVLANIATLPASDTVVIKIVTDNSNVLMSVDNLILTYTGQIYPTTNPTIDIDATISATVSGQAITALNTFVATETIAGSDNIKYAISNDNGVTYYYYNGASWQVSSGYATSSTEAEITAGLATFTITTGAIKFKIYLHSDSGLTTPSIDNLVVNYNDYIYSTANPTVVPNTGITTDVLENFIETSTIAGSDAIKYALNIDGTNYYYNGSTWAVSTGYAETNTAADMLLRLPSLEAFIGGSIVVIIPVVYLHSDDGSTYPEISNLYIEFDRVPTSVDTYTTCTVWGYLKDIAGVDVHSHQPIFAQLNKKAVKYGNYTVVEGNPVKIKPIDGRFEIDLLDTENMVDLVDGENDVYYIFTIRGKTYRRYIPAQTEANFWDLEEPEEIDE